MLDRIRNAWRALFTKSPMVTIRTTGNVWTADWSRMEPEEAASLMATVAEAVSARLEPNGTRPTLH